MLSVGRPYDTLMRRSMVVRAIQDPEKWMEALMLDPDTGLDPPGVKIRAAQGLYHHVW